VGAVPAGLVEDLELERFAVVELERRADELWAVGSLATRRAALDYRAQAREARAHVARLELALAGAVR
jgi:hypothetical protein